jgi:NAD(P)-dependent dehydrogenase (short-subunit alcohol dehydrogenase family)
MSKPIALILGAGKNIGAATAQTFRSNGYRVAEAARSVQAGSSGDDSLLLKVDLSKPESVGPAFKQVRETWGEPSVVVYNGKYKAGCSQRRC